MDFCSFRVFAKYPGMEKMQDLGVMIALSYPAVDDMLHIQCDDEIISGRVVYREIFATPITGRMIRYHMSDWEEKQTLLSYVIEVSQETSMNNTVKWTVGGVS